MGDGVGEPVDVGGGESSSGGIGHKLGKGRNLEDTKRTEFGSLYVPDCRVLLKPPLAKHNPFEANVPFLYLTFSGSIEIEIGLKCVNKTLLQCANFTLKTFFLVCKYAPATYLN